MEPPGGCMQRGRSIAPRPLQKSISVVTARYLLAIICIPCSTLIKWLFIVLS